MDQKLKEQVIATYTAYIDAFRANDVAAIDSSSSIRWLISAMAALRLGAVGR